MTSVAIRGERGSYGLSPGAMPLATGQRFARFDKKKGLVEQISRHL